jgi:uncharacterized repeat protein (TIGR03847 family)
MPIAYDYDLDPASFITIGTLGEPGERTFFLQAARDDELVSVVIEKEHADALAASIDRLIAAIVASEPELSKQMELLDEDMALRMPVEPAFRVSELGMGVDDERDLIVIVAHEVADDEPGLRARFSGTYRQMLTLARHATEVVMQGRPVCELCGEPIDPDGHFCIRRNGHNRPAER